MNPSSENILSKGGKVLPVFIKKLLAAVFLPILTLGICFAIFITVLTHIESVGLTPLYLVAIIEMVFPIMVLIQLYAISYKGDTLISLYLKGLALGVAQLLVFAIILLAVVSGA